MAGQTPAGTVRGGNLKPTNPTVSGGKPTPAGVARGSFKPNARLSGNRQKPQKMQKAGQSY